MTEKPYIKAIVVVEGRADTANLKRFFNIETYETGGSSIDATDFERLEKLHQNRGILVFTDPDFEGERIRKLIMQRIPTAAHAFLRREEAAPRSKTKGRSLGVEHASEEALKVALQDSFSKNNQAEKVSKITRTELIALGLLMKPDSKKRRLFLGDDLRMGYVNGKQLIHRLEMFSVSLETLQQSMKKYEEQNHVH